MKRILAALVAFGAVALALLPRRTEEDPASTPADQSGGWDGSFTSDALEGLPSAAVAAPEVSRSDRNIAAFLVMIRTAEGTAGEGGYGALFGWPNIAGRSFDPYTVQGHPKVYFKYTDKAGKVLNVSPAGAYQIVYTTWLTYQVPFRAWALINGYEVQGFTPATQDAFAIYLLDRKHALDHIKAGRLDQALAIAKTEWASLPGAGVNQPERSKDYVVAAYQAAGGLLA